MAAVASFDPVIKVVGDESLTQSVLPALTRLFGNTNWRVRAAAIELFPAFAKTFSEQAFAGAFTKFCESWLEDPVYAVREAGIGCIKQMMGSTKLGYKWAKESVVKKLAGMTGHKNWLFRIVPLVGIEAWIDVTPAEEVEAVFVPVILQLAKDKVVNIRIAVGRCLRLAEKKVKEAKTKQALKELRAEMRKDLDQDVRKAVAAATSSAEDAEEEEDNSNNKAE